SRLSWIPANRLAEGTRALERQLPPFLDSGLRRNAGKRPLPVYVQTGVGFFPVFPLPPQPHEK
ncbi:MAG TPA: hypothetical protein PKJ23_00005, partial [bacterium]|nr:hypothetical protein [bacterium]